ncbi:MAG: DUF2393 domain-containing protein [Campylobacter sp.]|nr:DUF2393 domain-containing protein [Campylobacter sp.]
MLSNLRQDIFFILENANIIDYLVYGWIILAFIFFFFIGVFLAVKWWWQVGFLVIFVDLFGIFFLFYYANVTIGEKFRPIVISPIYTKQLQYSNNLMLEFNLTNKSKDIFQICKIDVSFFVASPTAWKSALNSLTPFAKKTIIVKEPIFPNYSHEVKTNVENFAFVDYNTTIKTECF